MTISIVYSIMTTIRVGGAKSCPEGILYNILSSPRKKAHIEWK